MFFDYVDHPDNIAENGNEIGEMKRKKIKITNAVYIGKETSNIENVGILDKAEYNEHFDYKSLEKKILKLKPKNVKCVGIGKSTLNNWKHQTKKGEFNPNKKNIERIRKLKELGIL